MSQTKNITFLSIYGSNSLQPPLLTNITFRLHRRWIAWERFHRIRITLYIASNLRRPRRCFRKSRWVRIVYYPVSRTPRWRYLRLVTSSFFNFASFRKRDVGKSGRGIKKEFDARLTSHQGMRILNSILYRFVVSRREIGTCWNNGEENFVIELFPLLILWGFNSDFQRLFNTDF